MAHGMKWWLGGTSGVCLLIAVAYLPPRGAMFLDVMGFTRWRNNESEAVRRRNDLADQYRTVSGELEAALLKVKAAPILEAERAAGRPAKAIVLGEDSLTGEKRELLGPALDTVWRQLEMGNTKIALVLASPTLERSRDRPDAYNFWRTYLLPDSTDRTTCVVVYNLGGLREERPRQGLTEQRLRTALGPCAFYARFGAPSPLVRHWLDANNYDVTESSDWSGITRGRDYDTNWNLNEFRGYGTLVFYSYVYEMSFLKIACLAGRQPACVDAWKMGAGGSGPYRHVLSPGSGWRIRDSRLPDEATTLAALVQEAGEDAFQEFWTTSLPIDSALTIAVGKPAGEWLAERPQAKALKITLGPVPPLSSMIGGTLVGLFLLAVAAVMVQRRQVK
jgi:hypothetical protein